MFDLDEKAAAAQPAMLLKGGLHTATGEPLPPCLAPGNNDRASADCRRCGARLGEACRDGLTG